MNRERVAARGPWAPVFGYSRAVRAGNMIQVAGTAAVGEAGEIVHPDDAYLQARRCLEIITAALRELDAGPEHVVRTRIYITHAADWEAVGRAHGEVFARTLPVATLVVVAGLIDPAMRVEIEAEAVV